MYSASVYNVVNNRNKEKYMDEKTSTNFLTCAEDVQAFYWPTQPSFILFFICGIIHVWDREKSNWSSDCFFHFYNRRLWLDVSMKGLAAALATSVKASII